jgi:hypothetical protein
VSFRKGESDGAEPARGVLLVERSLPL